MQMKKLTYQSFLEQRHLHSIQQLKNEAATIIEHFRPKQEAAARFAPAVYLLDYATKNYLYIEDSFFKLIGYTRDWFLKNGLEAFMSKWHPLDFDVINTKVFPDNINFLKTIRSPTYEDYIVSYNYRVKNPRGQYLTVLQRSSYIAGATPAVPAGMVGVAFDITHYKNDSSIVHTIERQTTENNETKTELIFKKVHPVFEQGDKEILSKREVEIAHLVAKGMSSKQVAAALNLSIHTVNRHRKNMLAKTGCPSSSALVHFIRLHGII